MTAPTLAERHVRPSVPRPALLVVGVAVWFALYRANLPLWDWVVYDLMGLDAESRLGWRRALLPLRHGQDRPRCSPGSSSW